jgi:hypothetical protein
MRLNQSAPCFLGLFLFVCQKGHEPAALFETKGRLEVALGDFHGLHFDLVERGEVFGNVVGCVLHFARENNQSEAVTFWWL